MLISLHKQATTTPKIRAAIQASCEPAWLVAECYGISEQTVWTEPRARHRFERRGEGASATAFRTGATRRIGCRHPSRRRKRRWLSFCARRCCCRWTAFCRWCARS